MFDTYPKFVTDWKKKPLIAAYRGEMEEDFEAPRSHKSLSPTVPNSQMESSRPGRDCGVAMPPLSPLPARMAYTDQGSEADEISKTVLGVSNGRNGDSLAKMKCVAKFVQSMSGNDREYLSDTEAPLGFGRYDRYAASNWRNAGTGQDRSRIHFSERDRDIASDGYSSEGTKEEPIQHRPPRDYHSRSPRRADETGIHFERSDGRNTVDGGRGHEKHQQFQNYLKLQTGGYDLELLDPESRYRSPSGKKFGMMPGSVEDNPLAAMLQKFAVSGDSERFSVSPLKNVASVTASLFPGKGLPKKRRFKSDMFYPGAISYGLSSLHGSDGMGLSSSENGPSHPDVFICHICSFVATSNEDFKAHMTIHYDYQCPQCTYSSRTEGRLKRHIKDFHGASNSAPDQEEASPDSRLSLKTNQPKKFKCRQCHFISYSREEHWRHITVHIKKEKQLKCIHCPFVTEFKHHLEYHIRNHNNSKPYKCGKCNYTCVNKSMLNSHMKSHTNVYQFRCASCKYATKYSHSLKLHLINKKHLPAVVLNPDGSLPTDGSGSFELISKRGPPRGPRGPRKPKPMNNDVSPPALLPIFPTSSSPLMSFNQGSEYPWIPTQNGKPLNGVAIPGTLPPINGALLSAAGTLPSQSLGYPLNILSQLSSGATPPAVSYASDGMPPVTASVPCGFCPAAFSSLTLLADHVKMEHAQKLGGFGVKLEAKSPMQESSALTSMGRSQSEKKKSAEEVVFRAQGLNSKLEADAFPSKNVEIRTHKGDWQGGEVKRNLNSETTEIPLDLSSKNSDDGNRMAVKRSAGPEEEDSNSVTSALATTMSRKRSRKGKACKLDELSLKLQDRWKEEEGVLEGSESSSVDDDCQPGVRGENESKETERKFFEVACNTSSPPTTNLNDSGSWSWRKESPQYSDADSGDRRREEKSKVEAEGWNPKQNDFSVSDSNSSEGFTASRTKTDTPTRQPPDNGYYTCNYCDMGFRDNITHFLHMGYHTYDDPFKCNKCGHRSSDAVDFFVHMARVAHTQ